jgi:hypothetical protein
MVGMGWKGGNIIHAGGVRFAVRHPRQRGGGWARLYQTLRRGPGTREFVPEVVEVVRADAQLQHFLNDREKIS